MDSARKDPAEPGCGGQSSLRPRDRVRRPTYRLNRSFGRVAAILGCLVLACASCADAGGDTAVIKQVDLVGDWANAAGAKVHLSADHSLTASGINHAVPDYKCSTSMTGGRWRFWVQNGSSHSFKASDSATEGNSFRVSANTGEPTSRCDLEAAVQRDDRGFNICLALDDDQTCAAEELIRKDPAKSR
jgi:hypothetical protein